jgi:hypothetical protein
MQMFVMSSEEEIKRLFVPLASTPFEWFRTGLKRWELRRYGRQYTEQNIVPGREVELRRGYRSRADVLWGVVTRTIKATSLADFFDQVPFQLVIPTARDRSEAIDIAISILGTHAEEPAVLFGFEVELK